jgi:Rieske Fe-S protein
MDLLLSSEANSSSDMKRRHFVQLCAAAAGAPAFPEALAAGALAARMYRRAKLVDERGQPLRIGALRPAATHVFDYPFSSTPCFLLRLDAPTRPIDLRTQAGEPYRWEGGIGDDRRIVAYSAICAHKLTYPTRQVSFIGYRDAPSAAAPQGKVITCCSDRSIYDPAAGARVVSGPAPQPLAAILLEHDRKADEVHAVGTFGAEMFDEFFRKYDFRLQMEMGARAHAQVADTATVRPLEAYSAQWAQC